MSKKKSSQRKPSSPSAEAREYDDIPESISSSVLHDLLKAQECMFKSFMESIVSNLISHIDNLVKYFAGLKSSLEFSQKDIASHDEQLSAVNAKLKKHSQGRRQSSNNSKQASTKDDLPRKPK